MLFYLFSYMITKGQFAIYNYSQVSYLITPHDLIGISQQCSGLLKLQKNCAKSPVIAHNHCKEGQEMRQPYDRHMAR